MNFNSLLVELLLCLANTLYGYALIVSLPKHERSKAFFKGMFLIVLIRLSIHSSFDFINPFVQMGVVAGGRFMLLVEVALVAICFYIFIKALWEFNAAPARKLQFHNRFFIAPQPSAVMLQLILITVIFSLESGFLWTTSQSTKATSVLIVLFTQVSGFIVLRAILRWAPTRSELVKVIMILILVAGSAILLDSLYNIIVLDLLLIASGFLLINYWRNYQYRLAKANIPKCD